MSFRSGGGVVSFACDGTIGLTNSVSISADTVLDGTGRSVTISGSQLVRIFNVSSNATLTLVNLIIADGTDTGSTGGPQAAGESGRGGAIYIDGGTVNASNCLFRTNQATGGTGGIGFDSGSGYGGAIYIHGGKLIATNCTFISNQAMGGFGSPLTGVGLSGDGLGGAVYNDLGTVHLVETRLIGNSVIGGTVARLSGSADGSAWGGAVYSAGGEVQLQGCTLTKNNTSVGTRDANAAVISGGGGRAGGGAIYVAGGTASLTSTFVSENQTSGAFRYVSSHYVSSDGTGAGVYNLGELLITNCTFAANTLAGGDGGAAGYGGAIYNLSNATVVATLFVSNSAAGGIGLSTITALGPYAVNGGSGGGAGISSDGMVTLMNCTFFENLAAGGKGSYHLDPPTPGGPGIGGAVLVKGGTCFVQHVTFAGNAARGGPGGRWVGMFNTNTASDGPSQGGAIYVTSGASATLENTILANSAYGGNGFGTLTDNGNNLSSDATCNFTAPASLNTTDPKLGPLGDYGGSTATIPLLAGSPAIDGAKLAYCLPTDQRGIPRPFGNACDIGAFESAPPHTINGYAKGFVSPGGVSIMAGTNSLSVDPWGFYSRVGFDPGGYAVTPSAAQTRFVPSSRVVPVGPDAVNVDFTAYQLYALTVEPSSDGSFVMVFAGDSGQSYRTDVSPDLTTWSGFSTNTTDSNGIFTITDSNSAAHGFRFFRTVKP